MKKNLLKIFLKIFKNIPRIFRKSNHKSSQKIGGRGLYYLVCIRWGISFFGFHYIVEFNWYPFEAHTNVYTPIKMGLMNVKIIYFLKRHMLWCLKLRYHGSYG
jgi:hypothetical protein